MSEANNQAMPGGWNHLKRLAYFAAVVETGSFTAAAERLGITKAVVSQQVARLEREFHSSLLVRSTRKVQPTAAGQAFYQRCAAILADAENAFSELADSAVEIAGPVRLTAPFDYGISVVVPALATFAARYPQCQVDARFSDQTHDLMAGDVELAIRVGWLTDLQLQARQIGSFRQLLVASPQWQPQLARLAGPQDLAALPFVANTALREPGRWQFTSAQAAPSAVPQTVQWQPVMRLDATLAVRAAVLAGAGLSVLPDYAIADDVAAGRLVQVLPGWTLPQGGIHAVFPPARFRPAKVRALVECLVAQQNGTLS
ncbi:LysR family transcriptional regulator [Comamonas terrigena]|uniref:LysR family transcriptional regulator n=1 Tax=Comamonas terrigena TaxID=32013 RepID=UPI002446CDC8|nr:LysR family transcriptional regulator [Comamonas terrigena]MDH1701444.1 LysR family transcriptional regulator [Comamonas terrigena]